MADRAHDTAREPKALELLDIAVAVAQPAAALIAEAADRARHGAGISHSTEIATKSSPTDLVTEVDRAVERQIVDALTRRRPADGINGEEGSSKPGTSGVVWHIDPIDGTTNFVYGLPGFAVSIAAEVDNVMLAGAVVDPVRRETFTASRGGGAACNGEPIRCNEGGDLAHALVATGFSYLAKRRARQAVVLAEVLPRVRDIRRLGAAAADLCAVASGRVDAFYEKGLQTWDFAAGGLIAAEAGAVVGDLDGNAASSDFTLAAPPSLFEPLRALLRASGAASA